MLQAPRRRAASPLSCNSPSLCTEFANWRTSPINDSVNCSTFNNLRLASRLHSQWRGKWKCQEPNYWIPLGTEGRRTISLDKRKQIVTADWRLSVPGGSALFRLEGRVSIVREISFPETAEC